MDYNSLWMRSLGKTSYPVRNRAVVSIQAGLLNRSASGIAARVRMVASEQLKTSPPIAKVKIHILLADDHPVLRQGVATLLSEEPDMIVVGQAADGLEAVELALRLHPDVILMDITMPLLDGLGATQRISAELPTVRIIGLSMHNQEDMATAMRAAGAVAYLTKGGAADELLATIRG